MGAPGGQTQAQITMAGKAFDQAKVRLGRTTICPNGHPQAIMGMAADGFIHPSTAGHRAIDQGQIFAMHGMVTQLINEGLPRHLGFGNHQQPGSVLVETMDNTATGEIGILRQMRQHTVHQRTVRMSRTGMGQLPGRLVQDQNLRIFKHNMQGNILGHPGAGFTFRPVNIYRLASLNTQAGFFRRAIHANMPAFQQGLDPATADIRKQGSQHRIQSFTGLIHWQNHRKSRSIIAHGSPL